MQISFEWTIFALLMQYAASSEFYSNLTIITEDVDCKEKQNYKLAERLRRVLFLHQVHPFFVKRKMV